MNLKTLAVVIGTAWALSACGSAPVSSPDAAAPVSSKQILVPVPKLAVINGKVVPIPQRSVVLNGKVTPITDRKLIPRDVVLAPHPVA